MGRYDARTASGSKVIDSSLFGAIETMPDYNEAQHELGIQRERRFQTVLVSITTALVILAIGWGGSTLSELGKKAAVDAEWHITISEQMRAMYPASEAKRDVSEILGKVDLNSHRLDNVEGHLSIFDIRLDRVERTEKKSGNETPHVGH